MSGTGAPEETPLRVAKNLAIVAGQWHGELSEALVDGAVAAVAEAGSTCVVHRVPGAFEIPVVAAELAPRYDGVVALGVVVRGGTPHFDYVCRAVTDGCLRVSLDHGKPVGFGVLTVDDEHQGRERLGKGREAVRAVLETLLVLDGIRSS